MNTTTQYIGLATLSFFTCFPMWDNIKHINTLIPRYKTTLSQVQSLGHFGNTSIDSFFKKHPKALSFQFLQHQESEHHVKRKPRGKKKSKQQTRKK